MHVKHVNRFTIARIRGSFGLSLTLVALSMFAMVAFVPATIGAGIIWTAIALGAIVAAIVGAVLL
ncbi:hypothetical protein [Nocardia nova]|uniref:hypothetical protein n=1 Tax=Nocardia nova TaxID=37330 RepID=UPI0018942B74|nr:hypothetical protein [Nocardia nova]MBF6277028.1 hypothetical protein [Nocardia nova]